MPTLYKTTLQNWYNKRLKQGRMKQSGRKLYLFCDEFTNYNDTEIGIKSILLLEQLGYQVVIPQHTDSGRAQLSKGLLRAARELAWKNIDYLSPLVSADTPLIGIEPSAILCFRDEYVDLADDARWGNAKTLAKNTFLIDEFLASEIEQGRIDRSLFTDEKREVILHGHCQQKALSSAAHSATVVSFPANYSVQTLATGCCGMAGSFGYEKEHYDLSMQIGELVLFPSVRKQEKSVIISAPGTSCRHQIKDGTARKALHPVEVLYEALLQKPQ
jgi:Fe-S oxidoreductase